MLILKSIFPKSLLYKLNITFMLRYKIWNKMNSSQNIIFRILNNQHSYFTFLISAPQFSLLVSLWVYFKKLRTLPFHFWTSLAKQICHKLMTFKMICFLFWFLEFSQFISEWLTIDKLQLREKFFLSQTKFCFARLSQK